MNQKLNPWLALLIGLFFAILLVAKFWADGEALNVRGSDQMKHDFQGNLYVHFGENLYQFDPRGEFLAEINLKELGVYDLVGDFAFFKNGDLLIRRGRYDPSFPESVLSYMRIRDLDAPRSDQIDEGIVRCELQSKMCQPFRNDMFDLDAAFHVDIDWQTDEVYFSDTSRHQIFKFDQYGELLEKQDQGLFFPNQITLHDDSLWIADTNHNAVQKAESSDDGFGSIIASYRTKNPINSSKMWTYSFARIGDNWWVNAMDSSMSHGDVLIYDQRWEYQKHLALPEGADPMDISYHAGRVWVTDLSGDRVYYFSEDGEPLDMTMPEVFLDIAEQNQQSRSYYETLAQWVMYAFILSLAVGIVIGLRQNRSSQDLAQGSVAINWNDPNILWLSKNRKKMRQMYFLMGILGLLIAFMLFASVGVLPETSLSGLLVLNILIMGVIFYVIYRQFSVGLGRLGDILIIKNSSGKYAAGKGKQIVYSDMHVLIDKVFVQLNIQNSIFDTQQMMAEIGPLLKQAQYVERQEMQRMLLKRQNPIVIIIFTVVLFGMMMLLLLR